MKNAVEGIAIASKIGFSKWYFLGVPNRWLPVRFLGASHGQFRRVILDKMGSRYHRGRRQNSGFKKTPALSFRLNSLNRLGELSDIRGAPQNTCYRSKCRSVLHLQGMRNLPTRLYQNGVQFPREAVRWIFEFELRDSMRHVLGSVAVNYSW